MPHNNYTSYKVEDIFTRATPRKIISHVTLYVRVSVSLSVCHKPVLYQNSFERINLIFWSEGYLLPILSCVGRQFEYLQNGTFLWNFVQNSKMSRCFNFFAMVRITSPVLSPSMHLCVHAAHCVGSFASAETSADALHVRYLPCCSIFIPNCTVCYSRFLTVFIRHHIGDRHRQTNRQNTTNKYS